MAKDKKRCKLELVSGVEGPCLCLDDYRIAGPKPWGGGLVTNTLWVDKSDLLSAIDRALGIEKAEQPDGEIQEKG